MSDNRDTPINPSSGSLGTVNESSRAPAKKRVSRAKTATPEMTDTTAPGRKRKAATVSPASAGTRTRGEAPALQKIRRSATPSRTSRRSVGSVVSTVQQQVQPLAEDAQEYQSVMPDVQSMSAEERLELIQRIAYFRAAWRGWTSGSELDDWLHAEREVDAMLRGENKT